MAKKKIFEEVHLSKLHLCIAKRKLVIILLNFAVIKSAYLNFLVPTIICEK